MDRGDLLFVAGTFAGITVRLLRLTFDPPTGSMYNGMESPLVGRHTSRQVCEERMYLA